MKIAIVKIITADNNALYYTGQAGAGWLSENASDAFEYSPQAAAIRIESFVKMYAGRGLRFEVSEKPGDLYFSLVDNCKDEIVGHQARGGLSEAKRRELVADLARRYSRRQGQGFVQVRDVKSWALIETLELPA